MSRSVSRINEAIPDSFWGLLRRYTPRNDNQRAITGLKSFFLQIENYLQ